MNHYTEGLMDRPDFPKDKVIVNMPNVEMYELKGKDYHRFDVVLCKTRDGYERLSRWYEDNGNPRNTTLLYVQHTSSDPSTVAITHAMAHPESPPIKPKDFENLTFFHANGHSWFKSTRAVLECWQKRPDLPLIHVYSMNSGTLRDFNELFLPLGAPSNLQFHYGEEVDVAQFGRHLLEASAILCPSKMEGFGHYINQARASGALVLATNGPPMNEFIDDRAGVLIDATRKDPSPNQILSVYGGMEWGVTSKAICDAVDSVLVPRRLYLALLAIACFVLTAYTLVAQQLPQPLLRQGHVAERAVDDETTLDLLGDILHLNNLNEACMHAHDVVIPWTYNSSAVDLRHVWSRDKTPQDELIAHLAQCPGVDVFLPTGLRGHGYCEDGMAYVKFLKTRALPIWVFDLRFDYQGRANITYFDLCPKTALLFMNHYMDGVPDRPDFPKDKVMVSMPNVEMYELKEKDYHRFDVVLCKTQDCYDRLSQLYKDFGNPRNTTLLYVQHTSSDPSTAAHVHALAHPELPPIKPKDFDKITFFHANGNSWQKNTPSVLKCWQRRPDLPIIDVYTLSAKTLEDFTEIFGPDGAPPNVRFHHGKAIDASQFGRELIQASVILCPSKMEGYGHYINQARASGALVLTTNGPPMNEFVDDESGVLIEAYRQAPNSNQLLSVYGGMEWDVTPDGVCDAVDTVLKLTPAERQRRAANGRRRYVAQFVAFKHAMHRVRALFDAWPKSHPHWR
ncbi:hypothetical protein SDRG_15989 [Saprolegnia diclina VS20]|uniref:Glycosyl transferase family 1 domain-containing protein n=1 Tax=Saprolegnia diclina (strain VS20) TaxID=1156394 RepID=T0PYN1_SAPDV|nr:hypothetical protein SDRG_15989 [Saprolegnia diclina VS20]EQC26185.1 hypothetical protein SDRG_15989 [Saprolegnia diclina VS20]|eukprot:XP_008620400.1 hypothetical protein SDRG_15989 [Saprolegnia diclina VS20]